jgi:hypothetical protein
MNVVMEMPLISALVCFLIFLVCSIAFGVTSGPTSSRDLIKAHLVLFGLYLVFAVAYKFLVVPESSFADWLLDWSIGSFVYLSLHYSLFMYVHMVPRKSVSLNFCVTIKQMKGLTQEQLQSSYGQGKGMQYVVEDRIRSMEHMGMVKREGEHLVLTRMGLFFAQIHLLVLRIWSMRSNSGAENA